MVLTLVAFIWSGVALAASFPFWEGFPESFSGLDWACAAIIAAEPVFVFLAVVFWLTEQPRTLTWRQRNPDHDLRKLY